MADEQIAELDDAVSPEIMSNILATTPWINNPVGMTAAPDVSEPAPRDISFLNDISVTVTG